ncbi:hypothetical protein DBW61_00315 [bacterium]|nr:MAG: hypothetical protein CBB66_01590 [bacterium TMED6]RCL87801.1 MAG: hypothetical protein DBW61_00315 [bacterium]|tara:strand:+ start:5475 stop:6074 length:600 start_codon:yes stop_codon:yes gene_type:complete
MNTKLIKINLNQTVSRFELAEIKKEKNRWIIYGAITFVFLLILLFNFFIINKYNGLISSRLNNAKNLIDDSNKIRKNYENYNKGEGNVDLTISQADIDRLFDVEKKRISLAKKLEALAFDIPENMSLLDFEYHYDKNELIITLISEVDRYSENKELLIQNITQNFMNDGDFNSYDLRPEKDNHKQQQYYKVILTLSNKK